MSPILKRDISETVRQARRFASAATGSTYDDYEDYQENGASSRKSTSIEDHRPVQLERVFSSGADRRRGVGIENGDVGWGPTTHTAPHRHREEEEEADVEEAEGDRRDERILHYARFGNGQDEGEDVDERDRMISTPDRSGVVSPVERGRLGEMEYEDGLSGRVDRWHSVRGVFKMGPGQWRDLRSLLFGTTPSLLLSLVGLVFTGELLEHLARWRVFRRVDELFILFPMIGNLKGNLEMCLSARLGTSANIGELDHRRTRRALLTANMTLLGLQALLISCLAAVLSFALGLFTQHRLGDAPGGAVGMGNTTLIEGGIDPGLAIGEQDWHEGYTRPGWSQLVMVLATGMGSAGLSSAVLGTFMSSLIVLSRWFNVDPDNITPPVAACLGDLITLFILALLGTALVGAMDSPLPLICVILMSIAAGWFTRRVMRNRWVKEIAKGGWAPLIGAMLISSGTGMALDAGVGKYRGFALLAISMTGLTGAIGGIHANRLSTQLHTALQSPHPIDGGPSGGLGLGLSSLQSALTLFLLAFPCQGCFVVFVSWAGWIDLSLGWTGWVSFALTTIISLLLAHYLTLFFWYKDLDPDSYTLPIQSALVDFIGQLILMLAYEVCILQGKDVTVHE